MPGTTAVPATPGLSAYRTSVVHSAFDRPQVTANHHRLGSMLSIAPDDIAPSRVPLATPGFGAAPDPPDPPDPPLPPPPLEPQAASTSVAAAASAAPPRRSEFLLLAISVSDPLWSSY